MSHFFINNFSQADGSHEVHLLGCNRMPPDKRYLGNFYSVVRGAHRSPQGILALERLRTLCS